MSLSPSEYCPVCNTDHPRLPGRSKYCIRLREHDKKNRNRFSEPDKLLLVLTVFNTVVIVALVLAKALN